MEFSSSLSASCESFLKKRLSARFVNGWGWSLTPDLASSFDRLINGSTVSVIPDAFLMRDQRICGFTGMISTKDHPLGNRQMLATPMSDGNCWNFTDHVCPAWRLYIGAGELSWPLDGWPRLIGAGIVAGYGSVAANFDNDGSAQ